MAAAARQMVRSGNAPYEFVMVQFEFPTEQCMGSSGGVPAAATIMKKTAAHR